MKRIKLVELIKDKLSQKDFPYPEGAWEEAAAQFAAWDAQRRRKRRVLGLLFFLFVGTSTLLWYTQSFAPTSVNTAQSEVISTTPTHESQAFSSTLNSSAPKIDSILFDSAATKLPLVSWANQKQTQNELSVSEDVTTPLSLIEQKSDQQDVVGKSSDQVAETSTAYMLASSKTAANTVSSNENKRLSRRKLFVEAVVWGNDFSAPQAPKRSSLRPGIQLKLRRLSPFVEVGMNAFLSFAHENVPQQVWATQATATIGIMYRLNRRFRLQAGLQYNSRSEINHSLSRSVTSFDFVRRESRERWTPTQLQYVNIPVEFQYRLWNRHQLMLGGYMGYLMKTEGIITEELVVNDFMPSPPVNKPAPSYITGIARWDAGIQAGYGIRIFPRWTVMARYHMGLVDMLENDVFLENIAQTNNRLSIGLRFNW